MPVNPVYATEADYQTWAADEAATISVPTLRAASRIIDELLFGAVYDVDHDTQLATDQHIAATIRDATCAQANFMDETGDTSGNGTALDVNAASIGSVSYSGLNRAPGGWTRSGQAVSATAVAELRAAGLTIVVSVRG